MAGTLRVRRSRGALSGALLVLLGAWGGLIPFIGPYFHYAYTPDSAWTYTSGRLWLEVLPAVGALVGGMTVLVSRLRLMAMSGAWLAAVSGAWFVTGGTLATLWMSGAGPAQGTPVGGALTRAVEQIGFFTGLGAAVLFVAAAALGRLSVVSVRDARPGAHAKAVPVAAAKGTAGAGAARQPAAAAPAAGPAGTGDPADAATPRARDLMDAGAEAR